MKHGILIGADKNAEDLLLWWWTRYSRYCDLPVTIVDFGMSKEKRAWCKKRMQVIPFQDCISVAPKSDIAADHLKLWKKQYRGPLWQAREAWFKKPMACRLSPYELTLWLDLDCEVCGSLDPLFAEFEENIQLAIGLQDFRLDKPVVYNSGVILYRQGSSFLEEWDLRSHQQNGMMMGDQDVLTALLLEGKIPFKQLSPLYNWLMYSGVQPGIVIAHWAAGWGKEYIYKYGGLFALLKEKVVK